MTLAVGEIEVKKSDSNGGVSQAWQSRQRGIGRTALRTSWDVLAEPGETLVIDGEGFGVVVGRRDYGGPELTRGSNIFPGIRIYLLEVDAGRYWELFDREVLSEPLMYGNMIAGRPKSQ